MANTSVVAVEVHPASGKGDELSELSIEQKQPSDLQAVSIGTLLQFGTRFDRACLICGIILETLSGAGFPVMILLFGDSIDGLSSACSDSLNSIDAIGDLYKFLILGGVMLVLRFFSTLLIQYQQRLQIARYRINYVRE